VAVGARLGARTGRGVGVHGVGVGDLAGAVDRGAGEQAVGGIEIQLRAVDVVLTVVGLAVVLEAAGRLLVLLAHGDPLLEYRYGVLRGRGIDAVRAPLMTPLFMPRDRGEHAVDSNPDLDREQCRLVLRRGAR